MHCVFKTTVKMIILTIQKIRVSLVVYTNKHHYSKGVSLANLLIQAVCQRRATEGTKKNQSVWENIASKRTRRECDQACWNNISRSKSTSKRKLGGYRCVPIYLYIYVVVKLRTSLSNMRQAHAFQWVQNSTSVILRSKNRPVVQWLQTTKLDGQQNTLGARIHCSSHVSPPQSPLAVSRIWFWIREYSR